MAEAADRAAWNRTFAVLAQIYNANRGEGGEPIDPLQYFPWERPGPQKPKPPTPMQDAWLSANFGPDAKRKNK